MEASHESARPEQEGVRLSQVPLALVIRGVAALVLFFAFVAGLHAYVGLRLLVDPQVGSPWRGLGWGVLVLLYASMPLAMVASRGRPTVVARVQYWTGFMWMGVMGLLLAALVVADVVGWGWRLAGTAPEPLALARGKALAVVGGVAAAATWGFAVARGRARVERLTVGMPGLGPGLAGVRVVQISDIHIGPTLGRRFMRRVVEQVNALQPDLVAITGDLVDGSVSRLREEVAPLAGLRAPLGVYFVTGNHEYYSGARAWVEELRRLGLTVLLNEHRVVERQGARLTVAGVTDHEAGGMVSGHECRPELALAGAPAEVPRLLLAHQPRTAWLARGLGVDLQLSGHTHGGQLWPFIPFVRLQQPVIRGLREIGGLRVYTHRGTGYWGPPIRFGTTPEVAELTLVPAEGSASSAA